MLVLWTLMTTRMPEKYRLISGNEFLALQDSLLTAKKKGSGPLPGTKMTERLFPDAFYRVHNTVHPTDCCYGSKW